MKKIIFLSLILAHTTPLLIATPGPIFITQDMPESTKKQILLRAELGKTIRNGDTEKFIDLIENQGVDINSPCLLFMNPIEAAVHTLCTEGNNYLLAKGLVALPKNSDLWNKLSNYDYSLIEKQLAILRYILNHKNFDLRATRFEDTQITKDLLNDLQSTTLEQFTKDLLNKNENGIHKYHGLNMTACGMVAGKNFVGL
jgi:hypothetical protein